MRSEVRRSALVDLVRNVDVENRREVVAVLARILRQDADPLVREVAAIAIADNAMVELVPELLVSLDDPAPRVRQMVLVALGELAEATHADVVERVRPLLQSPLPALRYQALVAWRRLAGAGATAELVAALDDPDLEVRWIAWTLIEETVEKWDDSVRERLRASLLGRADADCERIRVVAASVLLRLGEPAAMARLLAHVQSVSGIDRKALAEVAKCFGQHKYAPARDWLLGHARRGWFEGALGWPATVALAGLGDAKAQHALLEELNSASVRRRGRALEAIIALGFVAAREQVRALGRRATGAESWLVRETLMALDKHQP
jgi:HEAT repeat protein